MRVPQESNLPRHQALKKAGNNTKIKISPEAREDLSWQANNIKDWNNQTIRSVHPHVWIETDASRSGWRAFCQGEATGGCWSKAEQSLHSNALEMLAVFFSLKVSARE